MGLETMRFPCRSLLAALLLLAHRVVVAQTGPGDGVVTVVPAPVNLPPETYSPWVLALAGLALLLLAMAGVKLVMNGLRASRHRRHRSHRSANHRS